MTTNAPPSRDPANDDSVLGMMRNVLDKFLLGVDDMIPARVIAFNRKKNRVQVQPLVMLLTTDGSNVQRAQVASVPVVQLGAGGFLLNFNLKAGDFGYLKANDRDISLVMQSGNMAPPNTIRKHSFEDSVFIPVVDRQFTIADEDLDNGNPVFQTLDGVTALAVWQEFVKVRAPRGLFVSDTEGEPDLNTVFHVASTVKASIPWPHMTRSQRNAIPSPKDGMVVWLTDANRPSVYNENISAWTLIGLTPDD